LQVSEWKYAQHDRSEELAELRFFSVTKRQTGREVHFQITVKEYAAPPPGQHLRFFAQADKPVNQTAAAIVPSGWGDSLLEALTGCLRLIREFPYEGEERE
jgi:hypothetical protein